MNKHNNIDSDSITTEKSVAIMIKNYFKDNGISQKEVAASLNITPQTLSYHLNGGHFINPQIARYLCNTYPFNYDFITKGYGRALRNRDAEYKKEDFMRFCDDLNPNEFDQILNRYIDGLGDIDSSLITRNLIESLYGNFLELKKTNERYMALCKKDEATLQVIENLFECIKKQH